MISHDFSELHDHLKPLTDPIGFLVSIFAYSPIGFAIWKPDGHLLLTNPAFLDLFGSIPPPDYNIREDDIAAEIGILSLINRAFAGEVVQVPTFWYDPRDLKNVTVTEGNRVAISMTVFPISDQQNNIQYVAATYKDNTQIMLVQESLRAEGEQLKKTVQQMQQAEQALSKSEQYFKALIQNAADVVQLLNQEGIITYVSPSVTRVLGYSPDEMIGHAAAELLHPDELEWLSQSFGEMLQTPGATVSVEQRIKHKNATWCWLEVTASNLLHDPSVESVVVNYHDINERKQAEENARAFQQKLKTLNAVSIELSQLETLDDLYRSAVVMGRERLGFDRLGLFLAEDEPNQWVGTYGTDPQGALRDEKDLHVTLEKDFIDWDTDRTHWNIATKRDTQLRDKGNLALGQGWNAIAMLGNQVNPLGWLVTDNLIHHSPLMDDQLEMLSLYATTLGSLILKKQAQDEILALNEKLEDRVFERTAELEASTKELEAFSYSISHDLRAPLRSIDGFSQILVEDFSAQLSQEALEHLGRVRAASQRMGVLIDDLLKLSRVTRGEMNRSEINLTSLAQSVADELQSTEPQRTVEWVIAPGLQVNADPNLMRIALNHLLGNAWKYTSKKPQARIEFGLAQQNAQQVYFVRDDGAGFDMAYAAKLFGAFQRMHTPAEFEGTGIGLATVQRIVRRHGGQIWAEAAVNQGATFYFTLPA